MQTRFNLQVAKGKQGFSRDLGEKILQRAGVMQVDGIFREAVRFRNTQWEVEKTESQRDAKDHHDFNV